MNITREDEKATSPVGRKVIEIVADQAGMEPGEVALGRRFEGDLPLDSLDVVEIMMRIEEAFDITVLDEDADKIQTVGDAIDYVIERSD